MGFFRYRPKPDHQFVLQTSLTRTIIELPLIRKLEYPAGFKYEWQIEWALLFCRFEFRLCWYSRWQHGESRILTRD